MSWTFTDDSLMVPVRIANPFLDAHYPPHVMTMAVLDTCFTGFLLIPLDTFRALKLDELRPRFVKGQLANGASIELKAAFGILEIPEIRFGDEGLIESNPNIREILLGMREIKKPRTVIDGCRKTTITGKCWFSMVGRAGIEPATTCWQCIDACQAGILTRLDDRPEAGREFGSRGNKAYLRFNFRGLLRRA